MCTVKTRVATVIEKLLEKVRGNLKWILSGNPGRLINFADYQVNLNLCEVYKSFCRFGYALAQFSSATNNQINI